jgi:putative FmdB family regulatory protein
MPIYAYRCGSCGHAKDVLQKLSDPPLTQCPSCGAASFSKQLTAAGFQLKGSGWYATDFKGGGAAPAKPAESTPDAKSDGKSDGKTDSAGGDAKPAAAAEGSARTAGCGTSCACH